jgi:hypothetical protein
MHVMESLPDGRAFSYDYDLDPRGLNSFFKIPSSITFVRSLIKLFFDSRDSIYYCFPHYFQREIVDTVPEIHLGGYSSYIPDSSYKLLLSAACPSSALYKNETN